jgi:hypothetical protein
MQVPTNDKIEKKFQYCCKCKDYFDPSQFENSELGKSKSGICNKHTNTLEPPETQRFCREWNKKIPIECFSNGQKRFICKKHFSSRTAAKCRQNRIQIAGKVSAERAWNMCYRDSKKFPTIKMNLTQKEILNIWQEANLSSDIPFIILPVNTSIDISKENVIVLTKKNRKMLMKQVKKGNFKAYERKMNKLVKI